MKYKYNVGDKVWVLGMGKGDRGTVTYQDVDHKGHAVYDVQLGEELVKQGEGSVTFSGISEYRVYEHKIGAAKELYSLKADAHYALKLALEDCIRNFDNADYIFNRLKEV